MAEKIGVFLPTYTRPDLLRGCVLQWAAQSRCPDIIVIHQNGTPQSYEWCISDLKDLLPCEWIFTPESPPQSEWYRRPLQRLIELGCSHFFWADHDDIYLRDHVTTRLDELDRYDFAISDRNSILFQSPSDYKFQARVNFTSHPAGGMSSSMAFNRKFALALQQDFLDYPTMPYADQVVSKITKPKFSSFVSKQQTTIYVSHAGSITSEIWLESALGKE
ncbi:hypothetical protein [Zhongshania sp.]|uniref:hypothetical protein n=1 Tax=Zhongshania sp. TaxID=1971902 RepID=UPI00356A7A4D